MVEREINSTITQNNSQPNTEGFHPQIHGQNTVGHEEQVLANLHAELQETGSCNMELYNQMIIRLLKK